MIEEEEGEVPLLELAGSNNEDDNNSKGGFRSLPFIMGTEGLEKMATFGLTPNMAVYLIGQYRTEMTTASNVLFLWSSATNFMPFVWAIMADSFLGQFYAIGFGSIIGFVGTILLWLTTVIRNSKPPPCDESSIHCYSATIPQFVFLCSSLGLISIGAGGIRSSCLAFGANQLRIGTFKKTSCVKKDNYISWYYVSYTFSILIAYTCIVYIQDNLGWAVGFAIPALLMLFAVFVFFSASFWYIKPKGKTSLVTNVVEVVVASYRNRHVKLSDRTDVLYHHKNGSSGIPPSRKLRFLNKACLVKDPQCDTRANGIAKNSCKMCTVDQVEELKSLLRVIPIWFSGMTMFVNTCQTSFLVLQATTMNRKISSFEFPAASFGIFTVLSVIVWVIFYDRVFLPLASRVTGRRVRISSRTRMGLGIFLSFTAVLVTAALESVRRTVDAANMSAIWLVPQYCLLGFAEASNAIAQNEFYFSELPTSMWSIAASLNGIGMALANLVASFILNCVDVISKQGGKESWISSNIDKGHYDYYFLVLAGLSIVNMVYFLVCSSAYGPLKEERNLAREEDEF
ncbi:putative peptide transporter-like [Dorcoceras hygrometricum]|uniref:Putative peptide transporter-like n=1 Tax=Dorcoceras hygrometricum TaxID=472368 RepID=A0A2Z7CVJ9_9LAMI|nr:putative peptide transporter-like [Dorcoceras hygrometricum]